HVQGILDPEICPDRDAIPFAAERCVQRYAPSLGVQRPPAGIQGSPGKLVALDEGDPVQEISRRLEILADDAWSHVLAEGMEGRDGVLRGVRRDVWRAALAPGVLPVALHAHQD